MTGIDTFMSERKKHGTFHTTQAVITSAGALKVKRLIHVNTPEWHRTNRWSSDKLAECYKNASMK